MYLAKRDKKLTCRKQIVRQQCTDSNDSNIFRGGEFFTEEEVYRTAVVEGPAGGIVWDSFSRGGVYICRE